MIRVPVLAALTAGFLTSACEGDETLSAYGAAGKEWHLVELDGAAFNARATIMFPEPGRVAGQAPCNRYFGKQTAPYPWFKVETIGATQMACPDLALEPVFFKALEEMTLAEISGDTLLLSNEGGREMLFKARQPSE